MSDENDQEVVENFTRITVDHIKTHVFAASPKITNGRARVIMLDRFDNNEYMLHLSVTNRHGKYTVKTIHFTQESLDALFGVLFEAKFHQDQYRLETNNG